MELKWQKTTWPSWWMVAVRKMPSFWLRGMSGMEIKTLYRGQPILTSTLGMARTRKARSARTRMTRIEAIFKDLVHW